VCDLETIGVSSIFRSIRSATSLVRLLPTFIIKDKARGKGESVRKTEGVGVMKDKELLVEETKTSSHTLGSVFLLLFICSRIKRAKSESKKCHSTTMLSCECMFIIMSSLLIEKTRSKLKTYKYESRCDERLKAKSQGSTRLTYTGLCGELEHLKIKTRLIDERIVRSIFKVIRSPSSIVRN
jgi:hypothetical protein